MFKFDETHPVTKGQKSFISRDGELEYLFSEIFEEVDKERGKINYSITGINRIGKTSLIKELCRKFDEQDHPNTFVLFTSLEGVDNFWSFWCGAVITPLIKMLDMDEVKNIDDYYYNEVGKIKAYFEDKGVRSRLYTKECDSVENEDAKGNLELFLSIIGQCGKNILLIIDEFDLAARVFGEETFFDWFRALLQDENHPLSAVTISRRSIYYIETTAFGGSTLSGTFKQYPVFGFKNSELEKYFGILAENGCQLDDNQKKSVIYYCGRSPFYLAIMGNDILKANREKGLFDVVHLFKMEKRYYENFRYIIESLKRENLYTTMLQLFVGPQSLDNNLNNEEIAKLIGNGHCVEKAELCDGTEGNEYKDIYNTYEEDYDYLTISNSFIDYLKIQKKQDVDKIFVDLMQAETMLRNLVRKHMEKNEGWKEKLEKIVMDDVIKNDKNRKEKLKLALVRYNRMREDAGNPEGTDDSILNVINLSELGQVITRDWKEYSNELPSDLNSNKFTDGMSLLNKVRNPVAHCNIGIVPLEQKMAAKEFSHKICVALGKNARLKG